MQGILSCHRRMLAWLLLSGMLLIGNGCRVPCEVSVYQNGKSLGVWDVEMDLWSRDLWEGHKRLVIVPARGVYVGSLYFRHGGVVVARRR